MLHNSLLDPKKLPQVHINPNGYIKLSLIGVKTRLKETLKHMTGVLVDH